MRREIWPGTAVVDAAAELVRARRSGDERAIEAARREFSEATRLDAEGQREFADELRRDAINAVPHDATSEALAEYHQRRAIVRVDTSHYDDLEAPCSECPERNTCPDA